MFQPTACAPRILRTLDEICETFGVGRKTVRAWARRGAPIAVEGHGARSCYSAEINDLQRWRVHASARCDAFSMPCAE